MALSSCCAYPQISPKERKNHYKPGISPSLVLSLQGLGNELSGQQVTKLKPLAKHGWCFLRGLNTRTKANTYILSRKRSGVCYSWLANSQIASNAFTWGTAAVLPFYTLMVVAPRAELVCIEPCTQGCNCTHFTIDAQASNLICSGE